MKLILLIFFLSKCVLSQEYDGSVHKFHRDTFGGEKYNSRPLEISSGEIISLNKNAVKDLTKVVFGFLPDWEYAGGMHNYLNFDLITHLACFDFTVDKNGNIGNPYMWPWTSLMNKAHENGVKVILTAVNFDDDDIRNIISNNTAKYNFFNNVKNKIVTYNLDGINVDFEGLYTSDRGAPINNFMAELKEFINTELPGKEVSFASPIWNWGGYWDLKGLTESVDYLFIMAYSFYGSWSTTSGPNAPLTGSSSTSASLKAALEISPHYLDAVQAYPDKLILGLPYYGLHWTTKTSSARSETIKFIRSPRFRDAEPLALNYGKIWDTQSHTPWFRWTDTSWNQIWYDDDSSMSLKFDLAIEKNLLGIGMWALGYDGARSELWDLIQKKFYQPTAVENTGPFPGDYKLFDNYPNPFNPSTKIKFSLPLEGIHHSVSLKIYDILGREVETLVEGNKPAGNHEIEWDTGNKNLSSGVYILTFQAANGKGKIFNQSRKLLLIK